MRTGQNKFSYYYTNRVEIEYSTKQES